MAVIENGGKRVELVPAGESYEEKLLFIERMMANCDEVQQHVLAEILEQNGETEYLRRHGLDGTTNRAAFKSKIPVVTYEDLQPDILRIADGDSSAILSGHPIVEFFTSSGTSGGERKLIPIIKEEFDRRKLFASLFTTILKQYVKGLEEGIGLYFFLIKKETQMHGGLPARPAITSEYKNNYLHARADDPFNPYTSLPAAVLCPDIHQSIYVQMLCGLLRRDRINRIGTTFASTLVRIFHFLQTNWEELARDIATGNLSPSITDPSVRASVAEFLRPDPDLARVIYNECSKSDWAGIVTRIWPNAKYLQTVVTGTMMQYVPTLEFYGGGIPIVSSGYGSSECYIANNLTPICPPSEVAYTVMPNMAYFEFLPDGEEPNHVDLVDLADVEIGKDYEPVITTYSGFYRYRVGDVLRVSGFFKNTPQFKFVRRKNVLLSIDSDKTNEEELQRAVKTAMELLSSLTSNVSLVDYTSHACAETVPGHYVIYWELLWRGEERPPELEEVMERCCLAMEEELNSVYRQGRASDGSIGPLEIRVVRPGTFEKLTDLSVSNGASINQYKVPRCVNTKPSLELLDSRVISAHFSPSLPRWSPHRSKK